MSDLSAQLADPDIYDDHQLVRELPTRTTWPGPARTELMGEWETAQIELEQVGT